MTDSRIRLYGQLGLAVLYSLGFFLISVLCVVFWDRLSKVDVGLATFVLTSFMNQSKDAGAFFFSHRPGEPGGPFVPSEKSS